MRKIIFLVLLAVVALAPSAWAQAPRGYYDQYGRYQESSTNDGYYDQNGQWHAYDYGRDGNRDGGYYDNRGVWHPSERGYDRYGRISGPDRWTWSDGRGRAESLVTAARNFALTARSLDREAARRSRYDDRAALQALGRLDEQAQYFARVTQQQTNRGNTAGRAYVDLVDAYHDVRDRFGVLEPDSWLSNQFHVLSAALGRIDKRFFNSRVFANRLPDEGGYGYGNDRYGYDRYGNPLPGYDRNGRDTRPYPY
jgi:hypothetical protein